MFKLKDIYLVVGQKGITVESETLRTFSNAIYYAGSLARKGYSGVVVSIAFSGKEIKTHSVLEFEASLYKGIPASTKEAWKHLDSNKA